MRAYFLKLFEVLRQATAEDQTAPMEVHDVDSVESQATYFRFSHFIKPDMLISLYGLLEFWLKELCDAQRRQKNLALRHSDKTHRRCWKTPAPASCRPEDVLHDVQDAFAAFADSANAGSYCAQRQDLNRHIGSDAVRVELEAIAWRDGLKRS